MDKGAKGKTDGGAHISSTGERGGAAQTAAAEEVELPKSARTIQVLVCDGDATHDWPAVFAQHGLSCIWQKVNSELEKKPE